MKRSKFIFIAITFIFSACSGSGDGPRYEKYTPKYEGLYVNSVKILTADYQISKEFYNDSIKQWFTTRYFGKDIGLLKGINYKPDRLQVVSLFNDSSSITNNKPGMTVYLINTSKDTFNYYFVQDGSLVMVQQALDEHGNWKPIESWCWSSCGNSYEDFLRLEPNTYITAAAPRYKGDFQTELRFVFITFNEAKMNKIYSEPFCGSVNLSQLEIPDDYVRGGIFMVLFEEKKEHHY
jgi:hypothetical protein